MRLSPILPFAVFAATALAEESPARRLDPSHGELPGVREDGAVLLPNQWWLRPVGRQVPLGDFPANIALHPGGKFAAVLHCGHGPHEIAVLNIASGAIVSRVGLEESFYGLAFSKDGGSLFASGSSEEVIHQFAFEDGYLGKHAALPLRDAKVRGIPCGLAVTADAHTLYAANVWGQSVTRLSLLASGWGTTELLLAAAPVPAAPAADASTGRSFDHQARAATARRGRFFRALPIRLRAR